MTLAGGGESRLPRPQHHPQWPSLSLQCVTAMISDTGRSTEASVVDTEGLGRLMRRLQHDGYRIIGPRLENGAIALGPIAGTEDLPQGWRDEQQAGRYRLRQGSDPSLFGFGPGPNGWKRFAYPASERLLRAHRQGSGFAIEDEETEPVREAFLGLRACDLKAIEVLDRVLGAGHAAEPGYMRRREQALIIAVNCTQPGGTCFCVSMGSGPGAESGFDLVLTERVDGQQPAFLVETGSPRGARLLDEIGGRPATAQDLEAAAAAVACAAEAMGREMVAGVAPLLARNLEHPRWAAVAERCLACGNCTMVCPTCFCSTVEDRTSLDGATAERWRHWDSCFTLDFSYVYGGSIRRTAAARYRQWMTHKLSTWHEQFGTSGCVGCGRCITWCPVGIDITEEARAIRDSDGGA